MSDHIKSDKQAKILVVDDHPLTRNMVKSILKGVGFDDVNQAENGVTALTQILEGNYELVICDWNMPGLSGLDVLKSVRDNERCKNLPFLMLTAEAYRENIAEAISSGVSDYMIKPFTAEVLINKVEALLLRARG